jgi:hypothetical protein
MVDRWIGGRVDEWMEGWVGEGDFRGSNLWCYVLLPLCIMLLFDAKTQSVG